MTISESQGQTVYLKLEIGEYMYVPWSVISYMLTCEENVESMLAKYKITRNIIHHLVVN